MGFFNEKDETKQDVMTDELEIQEPVAAEDYSSEVAVITASTTIEGNITTNGMLIVNGGVTGNITTKGNLVLSGNSNGDVVCDSVLVDAKETHSDIVADKNIIIAAGTTLNGNVTCKNITISGTVNGTVTASEYVILKGSAVVTGDVTAKQIGMETGALVNGYISMK